MGRGLRSFGFKGLTYYMSLVNFVLYVFQVPCLQETNALNACFKDAHLTTCTISHSQTDVKHNNLACNLRVHFDV